MIFAFRVDASLAIGSGHVMRCLTIADALAERGHQCLFLSRKGDGDRHGAIVSRGHRLAVLERGPSVPSAYSEGESPTAHGGWLSVGWKEDAAETRARLEVEGAQALIVDHYALDCRWEVEACPVGLARVAIDDLADRRHDVDLLIDQNLGRSVDDYASLVPSRCRFCVGTDYAMVRPRFAELRSAALERRSRERAVRRILISMGGVDATNASEACLLAVAESRLPDLQEVTVVMGGSAPHLSRIRAVATQTRFKTHVVVDVDDMAERMGAADLALGGAGGTAWERCAMGLPSVILVLAENQADGASALDMAGAADLVRDAGGLRVALERLALPEALEQMSSAAARIVDGKGLARLCCALDGVVGGVNIN